MIGFALPFPEPNLVAVGKEDVRNLELLGIILRLFGGIAGTDRKTLGLDHGYRASMSVTQHIVGSRAVFQHHLVTNTKTIGKAPALRGELAVDDDAREGFVGRLHGEGG